MFPDRVRLWRGAILATIGHALWIIPDPALAYELWWDGPTYCRYNTQGTWGAITFGNNKTVGVFRNDKSPRAPWHSEDPYAINKILKGMPADLAAYAHETALRYLFDSYETYTGPIITAAFWGTGTTLEAAESWADIREHGGHLIDIDLMDSEEGIATWQAQYEWSDVESQLQRTLFNRRMAMPDTPVPVTPEEWALITKNGTQGVEDGRRLLEGLGFMLPLREGAA
jgi:hypothetical protein